MPILSLSLIAALTILDPRAMPREQPLVTVISEPQSRLEHHILLVLDADGGITEVVRRSAAGETVMSSADLIHGRVALAGLDALWVSCPGCDRRQGGRLRFDYLHNGLTGRYESRALHLERLDGTFRLTTESGQPVRRLRLTARRLLGALVGIGDVVAE